MAAASPVGGWWIVDGADCPDRVGGCTHVRAARGGEKRGRCVLPRNEIDFLRKAPLRTFCYAGSGAPTEGSRRQNGGAGSDALGPAPAQTESRSFGRAQAVAWVQVPRGAP